MKTINLGTLSAAIGSSYAAVANELVLVLKKQKDKQYFIDGLEVTDAGDVIVDVIGSSMRSITLYQLKVPHDSYGQLIQDLSTARTSIAWMNLQRHFEVQSMLLSRAHKEKAL